jgi:hypothetical protein
MRREQIFKHPPGQPRVNALFEFIQHQPIPASAVAIIAREEVDVRAKAATAQTELNASLYILSGDDAAHRQVALDASLVPPEPGEYMSVSRYRLSHGRTP